MVWEMMQATHTIDLGCTESLPSTGGVVLLDIELCRGLGAVNPARSCCSSLPPPPKHRLKPVELPFRVSCLARVCPTPVLDYHCSLDNHGLSFGLTLKERTACANETHGLSRLSTSPRAPSRHEITSQHTPRQRVYSPFKWPFKPGILLVYGHSQSTSENTRVRHVLIKCHTAGLLRCRLPIFFDMSSASTKVSHPLCSAGVLHRKTTGLFRML